MRSDTQSNAMRKLGNGQAAFEREREGKAGGLALAASDVPALVEGFKQFVDADDLAVKCPGDQRLMLTSRVRPSARS